MQENISAVGGTPKEKVMRVGFEFAPEPSNETMICVAVGDPKTGMVTEYLHPEMARLYAELLNRCADLQDAREKERG